MIEMKFSTNLNRPMTCGIGVLAVTSHLFYDVIGPRKRRHSLDTRGHKKKSIDRKPGAHLQWPLTNNKGVLVMSSLPVKWRHRSCNYSLEKDSNWAWSILSKHIEIRMASKWQSSILWWLHFRHFNVIDPRTMEYSFVLRRQGENRTEEVPWTHHGC